MIRTTYAGALGYEWTETIHFSPVENYWHAVAAGQSEYCQETWHKLDGGSRCLRVWQIWYTPIQGYGIWRLKNPINIRGLYPGTNHRITGIRFKTLAQVDNALLWDFGRKVSIMADGIEVWSVEGDQITLERGKENLNDFTPNVDVSQHNYIDVVFAITAWMSAGGFVAAHYFDIAMDISYFTEVPPQTGVVEVYVTNAETGRPVGGALVQILSGKQVIAGDKTDGSGKAVFPNIPAKTIGTSYVLMVTAPGYYNREQGIMVKPNVTNRFEVMIDPKPFSWEDITLEQWILIGAGVLIIGGVAMAAIGRATSRERIMVVK